MRMRSNKEVSILLVFSRVKFFNLVSKSAANHISEAIGYHQFHWVTVYGIMVDMHAQSKTIWLFKTRFLLDRSSTNQNRELGKAMK
jgi:hypothetical protein